MNILGRDAGAIQNTLKNLLQRKDILVSLGILVAGVIFARHIYQQQHKKMQDIKSVVISEEERAAVAKEVAGLEDRVIKISEPYLKKDSALVMDKLSKLMAQSNLKVVSFSPLASEEAAHYTKSLFSIALRASYHRLVAFISLLESQPDLIRIEELSLSGSPEGAPAGSKARENGNNLNVNIKVSLTFLKGK